MKVHKIKTNMVKILYLNVSIELLSFIVMVGKFQFPKEELMDTF